MSSNSRMIGVVALSAAVAVLLSGIILRWMIIADLHSLLAPAGAENAGQVISRAGNLILLWFFLASVLASAPAFFAWRKSIGAEKKSGETDAPGPAPAMSGPGGAPSVQEGTNKEGERPGKSELDVSMTAAEEEPEAAADEEDARIHVSDPDRLRKIIRGLEELAQAQALGQALRKQQLELSLHLNDAVQKTRETVQDREIEFNLECEDGLTMQADPDCIATIIAHLLDNAAKAVKDKGAVTVSAAAQNGQVMLAVRDTGAGIRRKDLPHIFERFYRASGSGIGLGLTIVRELVDACGGRIEVETKRGQGSRVIVRIPHA